MQQRTNQKSSTINRPIHMAQDHARQSSTSTKPFTVPMNNSLFSKASPSVHANNNHTHKKNKAKLGQRKSNNNIIMVNPDKQ